MAREHRHQTVGRVVFRSQGALRWVRARGVGFGDDVKAPPPERYFWVRNALYSLNDPDNLLKLPANATALGAHDDFLLPAILLAT
jgi:hypothetical protein